MEFKYLAAIDMAKMAHAGQLRKYTGEPYLVHPFAVAGLVASVTSDDDMIVAAILHDIVEDTSVTLETIHGVFGASVCSLVNDLTDISKPSDGNRAKRKAIDRYHIKNASVRAKTIKLADLIDNSKTITAYDPEFSKTYMKEKESLLDVLVDGDRTLYCLAAKFVSDYYFPK